MCAWQMHSHVYGSLMLVNDYMSFLPQINICGEILRICHEINNINYMMHECSSCQCTGARCMIYAALFHHLEHFAIGHVRPP